MYSLLPQMLEIVAMNLILMTMDARYFGTEDTSTLYISHEFDICTSPLPPHEFDICAFFMIYQALEYPRLIWTEIH